MGQDLWLQLWVGLSRKLDGWVRISGISRGFWSGRKPDLLGWFGHDFWLQSWVGLDRKFDGLGYLGIAIAISIAILF